jgi:hypothetical protein
MKSRWLATLRILIGIAVVSLAVSGALAAPLCPAVGEPALPDNPCGELPANPARIVITEETLPSDYIPGEFLLRLRTPFAVADGEARVAPLMRRIRRALENDRAQLRPTPVAGMYVLSVPGVDRQGATAATLRRLARMTDQRTDNTLFSFVEPLVKYYAQSDPNDPEFQAGNQWAVVRINAPAAWQLVRQDDVRVLLAVVDSGVMYTSTQHNGVTVFDYGELNGRLWSDPTLKGPDGLLGTGVGANWLVANPPNGDPQDNGYHGTEVAGIAGAATDNNYGIAGALGPTTVVTLMPVKVLAPEENPLNISGTTDNIAAGITYAVNQGAKVINLSLGTSANSVGLCQVIRDAGDAGVLIVAAAGNAGLNNDSTPFYPASYPFDNVVSVMASNNADEIFLNHSNHGCKNVDLAAPGEQIATPIKLNQGFLKGDGTSMAAPFVSATAALVRAMNPDWTPAQVRGHLMDTTKERSLQNGSNGLLNMRDALMSPVQIQEQSLATSVTSGTSVTLKWKEVTHSRACSTVYVRLLPHGSVATHDNCSDNATCIELAIGQPVANGKATLTIPAMASTLNAFWRIGCSASGFFSERGPIKIN